MEEARSRPAHLLTSPRRRHSAEGRSPPTLQTQFLSTSPSSPFPKFKYSPVKPSTTVTGPAHSLLRREAFSSNSGTDSDNQGICPASPLFYGRPARQ
ncbi:hypothetical protein H4R33_007178, partial [Dimargaris cristalligena]